MQVNFRAPACGRQAASLRFLKCAGLDAPSCKPLHRTSISVPDPPSPSSFHRFFDPRIRQQPHHSHQHIARASNPRPHKGQRNCHCVNRDRQLALAVTSNRSRQRWIRSLVRDQCPRQKKVSDSGAEEHHAVQRHRPSRKMVLPHPRRDERRQRHPKQQMQIRPQNPARHMLRGLQQVMMVVPVNPHVNEAQHIARENRKQRLQSRKVGPLRRFHFQHHDRDDHREHPITKRLHPPLGHASASVIRVAAGSSFHTLGTWASAFQGIQRRPSRR